MANVSFSREDFLKANKIAVASSGPTETVEQSGTYIMELMKFYEDDTESGARMFKQGWYVNAENEIEAGKWVWNNQCIIDKQRNTNPIGLECFNREMIQLSEKQFDPDDYLNDPETCLEKFLGTKVKARVKVEKQGEYFNYTIKYQRILENTYTTADVPLTKSSNGQQQQQAATVADKQEQQQEVDLATGDLLQYVKDGQKLEGVVQGFVDGETPDTGKVVTKRGKVTDMVEESEIVGVIKDKPKVSEEMDLDIDAEDKQAKELVVGANVSFDYKGSRTGEVVAILEDEGKVKVKFDLDGKNVTGGLPIGNVTLI